MIAIPCVLYIDESNIDRAKIFIRDMDENPIAIEQWSILPDLTQKPYEIGSYRTPSGEKPYRVKVNLAYIDPGEADPDTRAGIYVFEVKAKNSLEAKELALDRFHETHPIGNLDAADINTAAEAL